MPQLDLFVFYSCFFSFFIFFGGLFSFHNMSLPFLFSLIKLGSNRLYYYYTSLLFFSSNSVCSCFLVLFFSIIQFASLCNKMALYYSISFFFFQC